MSKVRTFKSQVDNVNTGLTTSEFIVVTPNQYHEIQENYIQMSMPRVLYFNWLVPYGVFNGDIQDSNLSSSVVIFELSK